MKIKAITFISAISFLFLNSCSVDNDKSDAYGNFEATELIVSAQANGELLVFDLEQGDQIKKDQIVGLIDTTDLSLKKKLLIQQKLTIASQMASIDSEMEVVKQQLANNRTNQKRIKNLYAKGAATQKQLDDINGLVDLNEAQIRAVQSKKQSILDQMKGIDVQVEQVNEIIAKSLIKNPVDGTVLLKYAEQGELAGLGKPLYKLADLSRMKLKAYISGGQLAQIKIGQEVEVLYDKNKDENTSISGKIIWIAPSAEFTPKTIQTKEERVNLVYAVKVLVSNNGEIKIGMPGEFNFK
ncbi:MAG: efflux RND transporter periplasmic adaptor subunit [Bacteroidales bacterium]|nr:efflux RND transporter periplasmic adaptor subunit [Bacteroidales bacterium]MCF6342959.1 efflux RND transporter periplasmic adaptor subunit [Bacteroidales bacterium]